VDNDGNYVASTFHHGTGARERLSRLRTGRPPGCSGCVAGGGGAERIKGVKVKDKEKKRKGGER